jgi:peptidoglycan/xylan/chitin deacetylase (PgdA/CDA1 family)
VPASEKKQASEALQYSSCKKAILIYSKLEESMNKFLMLLISSLSVISFNCTIESNKIPLPPYNVVLTFDDGPNSMNGITDSLLSVLKKHQVKAYFSLIGENIEKSPDIAKRVFNDGHCIVNHGYDDKLTLFKSSKRMQSDMEKWVNCINLAIDTSSFSYQYFRPSYGFYWPSLKKMLTEKGLKILPISFYTFDAETKPADKIKVLNTTLKKLRKSFMMVAILTPSFVRNCHKIPTDHITGNGFLK